MLVIEFCDTNEIICFYGQTWNVGTFWETGCDVSLINYKRTPPFRLMNS